MLCIILTIETVKKDKNASLHNPVHDERNKFDINFNIKCCMYMYILHVPATSNIRLEIIPQQME